MPNACAIVPEIDAALVARSRLVGQVPFNNGRGALATAALLLLTVGLGLHLAGPERQGGDAPRERPAPAALASPAATPAAAALPLRGAIPSLPPSRIWTGIVRGYLDPGSAVTMATDSSNLLLVEAGRLDLRGDGPMTVQRAGSEGGTLPVAPGAVVTLTAGDGAVVAPGHAALHVRNPGPAPAVVVNAQSGRWEAGPAGAGYRFDLLLDHFDAPIHPPDTFVLDRQTLLPGGTVPAPPPGALQYVTPTSLDATIAQASDGSATNLGPDPVAVYILTIAPVRPSTPVDGATPRSA